MGDKKIYIVLTQTGTITSRIIKFLTGAKYNHSSISLNPDLKLMYSFGRINPYNAFRGGFVHESSDFGTFKRFSNTKAIVLEIEVDDETHKSITDTLEAMYESRNEYHYNYLGLWAAAFRIHRTKDNCFYCSEMIKEILIKHNIEGADKLPSIVHPMDFCSIPHNIVYDGLLREYNLKELIPVN